jgi:hypothetical protein
MKRVLATVLALLFLLIPCLSPAQEAEFGRRKDPILAGALSWYVPGLGQFYGGAIFKGAAFMVVEYSLLYATLITVAEVELGVSGDISIGLKINPRSGGTSSSERTTAIVLGTTLVVVHFINIIDAVNTSRAFNRRLESKLQPEIGYKPEQSAYRLGLTGQF